MLNISGEPNSVENNYGCGKSHFFDVSTVFWNFFIFCKNDPVNFKF